MSGCIGGRAEVGFNGDSCGCNGKEDKGSEITSTEREKEQKKRGSGWFKHGGRKAKKVMLFPFRKFQKVFSRSSFSSSSSPSSCSVSHKNSNLSSGKRRFGGGLCCCLCLSRPQTLEKIPSQGDSDPNGSAIYSYELLKSMIEGNDFYSEGCNTHLGY